ncbi:hypothetical protein H4R21_001736 [Coemansia helicoidea]|uniref:Uncharacterized protein n=1 Tax=Coemansia helicoidea TaxID=1286919 RepID=A0ACC1LAK5_9FUNG|nr:hypothetical protein H4R21_001736 [Coemansia helicoidea]
MAQYWNVLCIDNRRCTDRLGRLGKVFHIDPHILEYHMLRRRTVDYPEPRTPPVAPLERLPQLIKRRICAFLAPVDVDGLLCLILAVPHLAADGQAALNSHLSWAGKRIITLGDRADDVPQNVLTADEEECLLDPSKRTGYIIDTDAFGKLEEEVLAETYPRAHQFTILQPRVSIRRLVRPPLRPSKDAVLRNLTLKQYYRSSGDCLGGSCMRTPGMGGGAGSRQDRSHDRATLYSFGDRFGAGAICNHNCDCGRYKSRKVKTNYGLGQVLLIMTCWSSDPSTSFFVNWREDDVRGEWAGHRLDIVAPESVPADWEDVTEVVRAKMRRLCT